MPTSPAHSPARTAGAHASSSFPAPPSGRWLLFWRLGWSVVIIIDAALFVFSVPALFAVLHRPCYASDACIPAQLSLADFHALGGPGPALNTYVIYAFVTVVTSALVWIAVGALIAWRKWNDLQALFVSLTLITYAPVTITFGASPTLTFGAASPIHVPDILALSGPVISVLGSAVTELFYPTLAIFMLTFPTGRFAPRWTALFVLPWIALDVLFFVKAPWTIIQFGLLASVGSFTATQIYRYTRRYSPEQRQQTKWISGPFALVGMPLVIGYQLAPVFWPSLNTPGSLYRLAAIAFLMTGWLPVSLGIGIAILRYRLYDIDVIIRRTLIYGTLAALLALIYFASVIGLQALVQTLSGPRSLPPIAVVATTLLIATLFDPLRRTVQALIDRRFYRGKYDAARTLAEFGAALRTETNLDQLSARMIQVVEETMHPAHVSLWLRPPSARSDAEEERQLQSDHPTKLQCQQ